MLDTFSIREFNFPKDFTWGSATAGHQIEGNNINSFRWLFEIKENEKNRGFEVSGKAANSYEMWEEDVELLATLKHQMYRMSIEWSRIEPSENEFQIQEVEHYLNILRALKEKGIKVCVTLIHMSYPKWFADKGGIENAKNVCYFERYLHYLLPKISEYVDMWTVLNEINLTPADYKYNAIQFHAKGYHVIKQYSKKPVSSAHALVQYQPKRLKDPFDEALANYKDAFNNEFFFHAIRTGELVLYEKDVKYIPELKNSVDYWSVNTYVRCLMDSRVCEPTWATERYSFEKIDMIKDPFYLNKINPECIIHNLSRLKDKPVFITENGCCCENDEFRIVFITEYLCAINEAIKMGVDVKGFLYWSLLDNYEWNSFSPRFGLVDVDRQNGFKRTIKPSGYFLREIIENNGFKPEMLKKYISNLPKADFYLE